jgi:hypothetical protein
MPGTTAEKTGTREAAAGTTGAAVRPADATAAAAGIPVWFFLFEGVMAGSFDLLRAHPGLWPVLVAAGVVNAVLSLTVLRSRLRLAKALWKGRRTRLIALGLVALRFGVHGALSLAGLGLTSAAGHLALAVTMGTATVSLLWFTQRTALRALGGIAPMLQS